MAGHNKNKLPTAIQHIWIYFEFKSAPKKIGLLAAPKVAFIEKLPYLTGHSQPLEDQLTENLK
jgi:hypothetical protein